MHNYTSPRRFRAGILGYSGYSGTELAILLAKHPAVAPVLLDHRTPETPGPEGLQAIERLPWTKTIVEDEKLDVVFAGTPPEVSLEFVPEIRSQGARAIDLSGAFRLSAAQYARWYGAEHSHPELLPQAAYGLPELFRDRIRTACLVANPGCYPTAATCALWPLVQEDWIDRSAGIICDAKSGVTGAGKSPTPKTHFVQVYENFSAYAVLQHRHVPEVLNCLGLEEGEFEFTAQLIPIQRGILETIYVRLRHAVRLADLLELYGKAYRGSPFIRLPQHFHPQGTLPQVSSVQRTNFCDIHFVLGGENKRLVIVSCIDNLVKGAAGQAIQNMNLLLGLEETDGLI